MQHANRRRIYRGTLLALTGLWLLTGGLAGAPAAAQSFSDRSLQGAYGFIASGTLGGTPGIAVGRYTFDGEGACGLVATINLGATGDPGTLTATSCTYAVQPDGTGTLTEDLPPLGGPFNFAFVIVNNRTEVHMITVDPGVSATVLLKKQ